MLQEARARWLGEPTVHEIKLARVSRSSNVARGTSEVARRTCGAGKKVGSHGLADPAKLQEAQARWLGELKVQESKLARVSRPNKVARGEQGGSANLRCRRVSSHGLADPAKLQEARASWFGELAVQENPARLQEARTRSLGELKVQGSKLARVSRPGKVAKSTSEEARRTLGAESELARVSRPNKVARGERGGSANLRCRKVNSDGLADPGRKVSSHELADPAGFQEAPASWLGELALQEVNLARVSTPGKVARGTSEVARRTCGAGKHEPGGSANLRCRKVNSHELANSAGLQEARARWLANLRCKKGNSHGLADPARLQEARGRWLNKLAEQESNLARISRPGKVARGTNEVARRTCGARN
ncbi:hypothetical protein CRG98_008259 [Punica granatum]|uniref:Uncharacterized protein n=1 Tax=Punica granatum TaxID=22663 RepID=A0A2I0KS92_PUNGR|nr:hypothetical protein CRG98_008259 [Punica granatum]